MKNEDGFSYFQQLRWLQRIHEDFWDAFYKWTIAVEPQTWKKICRQFMKTLSSDIVMITGVNIYTVLAALDGYFAAHTVQIAKHSEAHKKYSQYKHNWHL